MSEPVCEVHLYWLATAAAETADSEALLVLLDPDERARHDRFVRELDRHHYRAAHALTRMALSRHQPGVAPGAWRFRADAHGRPEIAAPASSLRFNLSHTSGLVACAVSDGWELGVDVEELARPLEIHELAEAVFAPVEREALRRAPEGEARGLFFELWTLKEAYVKALGLGLSANLASFWFEPRPPRFASAAGPEADASWSFHQARPTPGHWLALAVRTTGARLALRVHALELRSLLASLSALGQNAAGA